MEQTDLVFLIHLLISLLSGLIVSILSLPASLAFLIFIFLYLISSKALDLLKVIDVKKLSQRKLYSTGIFSSFLLFIVTWVLFSNVFLGLTPNLLMVSVSSGKGWHFFSNQQSPTYFLCFEGKCYNSYYVVKPYDPATKNMEIVLGSSKNVSAGEPLIYVNTHEGVFYNSSSKTIRPIYRLLVMEKEKVTFPWVSVTYNLILEGNKIRVSGPKTYLLNLNDFSNLELEINSKRYPFSIKTKRLDERVELLIYGPHFKGQNISIFLEDLNLSSIGSFVSIGNGFIHVASYKTYTLTLGKALKVDETYLFLSGPP